MHSALTLTWPQPGPRGRGRYRSVPAGRWAPHEYRPA